MKDARSIPREEHRTEKWLILIDTPPMQSLYCGVDALKLPSSAHNFVPLLTRV